LPALFEDLFGRRHGCVERLSTMRETVGDKLWSEEIGCVVWQMLCGFRRCGPRLRVLPGMISGIQDWGSRSYMSCFGEGKSPDLDAVS
jgi:hypothetical protein